MEVMNRRVILITFWSIWNISSSDVAFAAIKPPVAMSCFPYASCVGLTIYQRGKLNFIVFHDLGLKCVTAAKEYYAKKIGIVKQIYANDINLFTGPVLMWCIWLGDERCKISHICATMQMFTFIDHVTNNVIFINHTYALS